MKVLCALFLLFGVGLCARAQQAPAASRVAASPAPAGLSVVKFSWSKERINWERDPFGGPVEGVDEMHVRTRDEKRIEDAKRGSPQEVERYKREARADAALFARTRQGKAPRYVFMYKATVRNDGDKAVTRLDWDYVFYDAATQAEVGRQQFTSAEKIAPGKQRELVFTIAAPPARVISADSLDTRRERDALTGQVVLVLVLYADGTAWQRPRDSN